MKLLKVNTSIKTELKRLVLLRGTILAAAGAFLILYAGLFMPPEQLGHWGWLIFLLAGALIMGGLYPYKQLVRKEERPDSLQIDEENGTLVVYLSLAKGTLTIPASNIKKVAYQERKGKYGMLMTFQTSSRFFPYFSENSVRAVRETLEHEAY